jgi:ABC-type uncharacterized transport system substrate-binding protein
MPTDRATAELNLEALRKGLREIGYVEGQNLAVEYRFAEGRDDRLPELAAELVQINVKIIVTWGTPAGFAAKNATSSIPIVMATAGDPVGTGLVSSLAHPAPTSRARAPSCRTWARRPWDCFARSLRGLTG